MNLDNRSAQKKYSTRINEQIFTRPSFPSDVFIPVAGSAAGSIGGGLLRTIINISGELGNLAVGIYSVVDEPGNPLVSILGMLLGGVNIRPFKEIATYRRNMKSEDLNQLGPIKKDLDRIEILKAKGRPASCGIR